MSNLPTLALLSPRRSPWAPTQPAALAQSASLELPLDRFQLALQTYLDADGLARLGRARAEVVILDLRAAAEPRGLMILPVRRAAPGARLIVLGPAGDQALADCAVRLGAFAYLSGEPGAGALQQALIDAGQGDAHYGPTGKRALANLAQRRHPFRKALAGPAR
jgi:DNA-binding NarL/FixJ family response regulator